MTVGSSRKNGGGVDVGGGHMRVALENELGVLQCASAVSGVARNAGGFDEGAYRIGKIGDDADQAKSFDVGGEFGPALETMFACEDELRVGEGEGRRSDVGMSQLVQARMVAANALECVGIAQTMRL